MAIFIYLLSAAILIYKLKCKIDFISALVILCYIIGLIVRVAFVTLVKQTGNIDIENDPVLHLIDLNTSDIIFLAIYYITFEIREV